jgi:hypothetical protein
MDFFMKIPFRFKDLAQTFFEQYEYETIGVCYEQERSDLKLSEHRTCRFCGKYFPEVKFNNIAHIIPEFLGNKYFVSDFECDTCNMKLGRLDTQLANFIGMFRSIFATEGKNGIPTIDSHDSLIQAKHENFFGASKAIKIGSTINDPSSNHFDREKNEHVIEYRKQPYIPFDVYKSLLKMGLSLLDESEVPEYKLGFEFLRRKKMAKAVTGSLFSIIKHSVPFRYEHTCIWLFKRKDSNSLIPPYTLILVYGSFVYQIFIPFDTKYFGQMKDKEIDVPIFPPYYESEYSPSFENYFFDIENICSIEPRHTTEKLHFQIDPSQLKDLSAMDIKTKKKVEAIWNPDKIVSFILVHDKGFVIKPQD